MSRTIHISSEVLCRELQGEAVLLDLDSQRYFGLDAVGTRIWQLLDQHGEPHAVLNALEEEFDADRKTLEHDLQQFLQRLTEAGLITVEAPAEAARATEESSGG
ncbi:MAG: PqqD family protein [Acidobacteriota bacterium]|nr:PqqD family protein [Acidobacteriota bacterium]